MQRQADLLEVIGALGPPGRLPRRLDRRQQQGNQDADDGDHHQKLDQRKAFPKKHPTRPLPWHAAHVPAETSLVNH